MLEKEFEFYQKNKEEILKSHLGKFVVIKDQKIQGSYNSREDALAKGKEKFKMGSFLIQHVVSDDSEEVQRFHSRIAG